ncbi:MAG: lipocalin-like domain-containing protein [bacterium]
MTASPLGDAPLSIRLPGTWRLISRVDVKDDGTQHLDPALGSDPVALLIYDQSGHFAAQFMKRDRSTVLRDGPAGASNNTQAQGGYDAYFGTYTVDDATSVVTQRLEGSLSQGNVGAVLSRAMRVQGKTLVITLATTAWDGAPVTRTLTWERVGS